MPLPEDPIETIHRCVQEEHFRVGWHAVQHMFEEGFSQDDLLEVVSGKLMVLEEYEEENRVLVLGHFRVGSAECPLHVVCEFSPQSALDFITAYIPGRPNWINPRQRG